MALVEPVKGSKSDPEPALGLRETPRRVKRHHVYVALIAGLLLTAIVCAVVVVLNSENSTPTATPAASPTLTYTDSSGNFASAPDTPYNRWALSYNDGSTFGYRAMKAVHEGATPSAGGFVGQQCRTNAANAYNFQGYIDGCMAGTKQATDERMKEIFGGLGATWGG